MKRWMRIAVSAFFGVVAVLLCVLWVRGLSWVEQVIAPIGGGRYFTAASFPHRFEVGFCDASPNNSWAYVGGPVEGWLVSFYFNEGGLPAELRANFVVTDGSLIMPAWFAVLAAATLVVVPWMPGRFSLRTLLIFCTAIAVGLGLVVWIQ